MASNDGEAGPNTAFHGYLVLEDWEWKTAVSDLTECYLPYCMD